MTNQKTIISLFKAKLLITLYLIMWLSLCHGQINSGAKEIQKPIMLHKSKVQISQVVRRILQDRKGNYWFACENGAWKLTNQTLTHIDSIKCELGKRVTIHDIAEGKDGKIWLAHTDGISSVDGEKVENYYVSDGLVHHDAWSIAVDRKGKVWIGTLGGVSIFDGHKFSNLVLPEGQRDTTVGVSSTKMVNNILVDSKGVIWFSTTAGLFSYEDEKLTNISKKVGIQTNFVNEIVEDQDNVYWVSTKQGLYYLKDDQAINLTLDKIETGKGIGSIAKDENGKIWFVSNQHYLYTYHNNELTEFKKEGDNKGPVVFQIYKDHQHRLWFVGFGGAYRLENDKFVNVTKDGPW